ncbi:MAG: Type 1 glutamine amidotransferase-like domain-containing protein [Lachnospiraceae bacterium]|nr:Type 1 glutamine amidotransferase-like domain-containing protein [Lachnospiraceae bacterium]
MVAFLTSDTGGLRKVDGKRIPVCLNNENGMVDRLKKYWKKDSRILFLSASPEDIESNDSHREAFEKAFPMSGLSISAMDICDSRNEAVISCIKEYDVLFLSGGHVPTQNAFFRKIGLKQAVADYKGIVIALSAGSMNCAKTVYAIPELRGEGKDMSYQRFIEGLGLTKSMIIPHYQWIRDEVLDGMRVIEDIALSDSMGKEFIALNDGSYILAENGSERVYGEAYRIKDGNIIKLCGENESVSL